VGSEREVPFDVRLLATTNRDLEAAVEESRFRQDLFFRINVIQLELPPLRSRGTDALLLSQHFIEAFATRTGKNVVGMSESVAEKLLAYSWPGNVRELEHFIENLMIRHEANQVELSLAGAPKHLLAVLSPRPAKPGAPPRKASLSQCLRDIERGYILESLDRNGWKITRTAEDLGIIRQSLIYRMKKLNILFKGRD
jgi:transcriptional regulator with PAS, ATPase and Fis domain